MSTKSVSIPRESVEYVRAVVTVDGVEVTAGVSMAVTAMSARPTSWTAAVVVDGHAALLVGPGTGNVLAAGSYRVWAKVTDSPEVPVVDCGMVTIT